MKELKKAIKAKVKELNNAYKEHAEAFSEDNTCLGSITTNQGRVGRFRAKGDQIEQLESKIKIILISYLRQLDIAVDL